jgi:hypothetical protein
MGKPTSLVVLGSRGPGPQLLGALEQDIRDAAIDLVTKELLEELLTVLRSNR